MRASLINNDSDYVGPAEFTAELSEDTRQSLGSRKPAVAARDKHGNKPGPGRDYWIKEIRYREMELVANVEASYARMVEA